MPTRSSPGSTRVSAPVRVLEGRSTAVGDDLYAGGFLGMDNLPAGPERGRLARRPGRRLRVDGGVRAATSRPSRRAWARTTRPPRSRAERDRIAAAVNERLWSEEEGFYFDADVDGPADHRVLQRPRAADRRDRPAGPAAARARRDPRPGPAALGPRSAQHVGRRVHLHAGLRGARHQLQLARPDLDAVQLPRHRGARRRGPGARSRPPRAYDRHRRRQLEGQPAGSGSTSTATLGRAWARMRRPGGRRWWPT